MPDEQAELPTDSSYLFNADAQAVLAEAPNLDSGLALLTEAYSAKKWDDPAAAASTAQNYGTLLRQKFEAEPIHPEKVLNDMPYHLTNFKGEGESDDEKKLSQIQQWEDANKTLITKTNDPDYTVNRNSYVEGIENTASMLRRQVKGTGSSWIKDKAARSAIGLTEGIANLLGTDGFIKSLQEETDPERDDDFSSTLASGAGNVAGIGASALVGGPLGATAYMGANAAGSIKKTYQDALKNTGDSEHALIAGALETGSQAVAFAVGSKTASLAGQAVGRAVFGKGAAVAEQSLLSSAGRSAAIMAGGAAVSTPLSEAARIEGSNTPTPSGEDLFKEEVKQIAAGAVLGAATGVVHGVANRRGGEPASVDSNEPPPTEPPAAGVLLSDSEEPNPPPITEHVTQPPPARIKEESVAPIADYTTEDGSTYTLTPDGQSASRTKQGKTYNASDRTFYADEATVKTLSELRKNKAVKPYILGDRIYFKGVAGNELVKGLINYPDIYSPKTSESPSVDSYPIQISRPRSPNGAKRIYQLTIGKKITALGGRSIAIEEQTPKPGVEAETDASNANPVGGQSVGAEYAGVLKRRSVAERVLQHPNTPEQLKQDLLEFGADYFEKPNVQTADKAQKYIAEVGQVEATKAILNRGENESSPEMAFVAAELYSRYIRGSEKAFAAGDLNTAKRMSSYAQDMVTHAAMMGTKSGQTSQIFAHIYKTNPEMFVLGLRTKLEKTARQAELNKQGITPEAHAQAQKDLSITNTALSALEEEGKAIEAQKPKPKLKEGQVEKETDPIDSLPKSKKKTAEKLRTRQKELQDSVDSIENNVEKELERTADEQDRLTRVLRKIQDTPEGSTRDKLVKVASDLELKIKGPYAKDAKGDFLWKYWLANVLSGTSTWEKKGGFDIQNAGIFVPISFALGGKPGAAAAWLRGVLSSAKNYTLDTFIHTLKTGKETYAMGSADLEKGGIPDLSLRYGHGSDLVSNPPDWSKITPFSKLKSLPGLEGVSQTEINAQPVANLLSKVGYSLRFLGAIQNAYHRTMQEGASNAAAYLEARDFLKNNPNASTEGLRAEIGQRLANTTDKWNGFLKQAESEAALLKEEGVESTPRDIRLRASELMLAERAPKMANEVNGLLNSLSLVKTPTGLVGTVVKNLYGIQNAEMGFAGKTVRPFKYLVTFLNVMGNLINLGTDYVPGARLLVGTTVFDKSQGQLSQTALIGRQMTGAVLGATVLGLMSAFRNDKDPYFWVYGKGPSDAKQRDTFYQSGGRPWTVKIGENYFSYHHGPLMLLLGGLGTIADHMKYDSKYEPTDSIPLFLGGTANSFIHQSFLSKLGNFVDALGSGDLSQIKRSLEGTVVDTGKGFIPGAGALRTLTRMFEEPVESYHDLRSKIVEGIPFAQEEGIHTLNIFGETTKLPAAENLGTFYTNRTSDPEIRWLAENGYALSIPTSVEIPGIKGTSTEEERKNSLGAKFADYLTVEERTKLVKEVGPKLRELVKRFRNTYSYGAHREEIQNELNKEALQIIKSAKQKMFIH